jgi:tight adherence protein C
MNALALGVCVACTVALLGAALRPSAPPRPVARATRPSEHRWRAACVVVAVTATLAVVAGPFAGGASIVTVALAKHWRGVRARARRQRLIDQTYPDAIDLVVLAVRSGFLPAAALEVTTPHLPAAVRGAFASVTARVATGERFGDALAALDQLGPIARPLVDTFAAADRYGLALAPVLERLGFEARQQRRRAADAAARQLPVRLSLPLVLCTLPSFVLLAIVPLLLGAFSSLHTP